MGVTFPVSPDVERPRPKPTIDHSKLLRSAFRRPIEALWQPERPLIVCDDKHGLLNAVHDAFYDHHPLVLTPDLVWLTLARGFALHVNHDSEELRRRFVDHDGKEKLVVERPDFLPGADNPWPEAFEAFSKQVEDRVGRLCEFVRCNFSTTGPLERAVSNILVMDTFQAYFEYEMRAGCGIPEITLTGTLEDWRSIRQRAALFGEFGLEVWATALDPVLAQFESAARGEPQTVFWQSMFRYRSGSGPSVMTGWINVFFPYIEDEARQLTPNPYLWDWERHFDLAETQSWRDRSRERHGVGMSSIPSALAAAPVKLIWGKEVTKTHFVGGLVGVSQAPDTLALQAECGWAVVYDTKLDPMTPGQQRIARWEGWDDESD